MKKSKQSAKKAAWKGAVVAAAVCLFLTCSVTALAASVPVVNDFIYKLSPEFARVLYPVSRSSEDQGIKLEVLYAANDNHSVVVYFSIQDMEGKGRVSENLDLCDSEYVEGPFAFGTELIFYEEETNTAYYKMEAVGGTDMANRMVTFGIRSLMSNKTIYDWYDTKIDFVSSLEKEAETIAISEVECSGMSTLPAYVDEMEDSHKKILKPDVMDISLGQDVDFLTISNMGFVDGKLHIQTKWEKSFDNHGDLLLVKKNAVVDESIEPESGNVVYYDTIYFSTKEMKEDISDKATMHWQAGKYIEYIYDVGSLEELANYNLWGWFVKDGIFTDGSWKVNFRMSDVEKDSLILTDVKGIANRMEITPIGIYIEGYEGSHDKACVCITLKNGKSLEYNTFSCETFKDGKSNLYTTFGEMFDVSEVESITFNRVSIYGED